MDTQALTTENQIIALLIRAKYSYCTAKEIALQTIIDFLASGQEIYTYHVGLDGQTFTLRKA